MKHLLLCLGICWAMCGNHVTAQSRPHVFIVLCDDLGFGDLGINGHPYIQTPHIDSFAQHSRQLAFYAGSAICSPSRTALMTGRVPSATGVYSALVGNNPNYDENYELVSTESNVVQLLRDNGYATFHSGKWHLTKIFGPNTYRPLGFDDAVKTFNKPARVVFDSMKNLILQSLATHPQQPIFGIINPHEAHAPIDSLTLPPYDSLMYALGYDTITQDLACHLGSNAFAERFEQDAHFIKNYYGSVSNLDLEFGRFLSFLDELGIRDSSLILFTSDNGPEDYHPTVWGSSGCEMSGLKRQLYEGGIRVPGFLQLPGRWDDGQEITTPTGFVDIYPTFAKLLGLDINNGGQIHGEDVVPIWDNQQNEREKPMFFHLVRATTRNDTTSALNDFYGHAALKSPDGRYKLMAEMECIPPPEYARLDEFLRTGGYQLQPRKFKLFDLWNDPIETHDLQSEQPELFEQLLRQFLRIDRGIRRQAPRFLAQSQYDKSERKCSDCPQVFEGECPEEIFLALDNQFMPDFTDDIWQYICSDTFGLRVEQYPSPGIEIGSNIPEWIDLHVMQGLDHVAACHVPVVHPLSSYKPSEQCPISIAVSPNPARDIIKVSCKGCPPTQIEVMCADATGHYNEVFKLANSEDFNISVSHLPSGVYFLRLQMLQYCGVAKFVKE